MIKFQYKIFLSTKYNILIIIINVIKYINFNIIKYEIKIIIIFLNIIASVSNINKIL